MTLANPGLGLTPLERADFDPHAAWRVQSLRKGAGVPWPDDEEKEDIVKRLSHKQDDETRLQALVRLRSVAAGRDRHKLWLDDELRKGLLACAEGGPDAEMLAAQEEEQKARVLALGVLIHALCAIPNRLDVLQDEAARAVLLRGVKPTSGEDVSGRATLLFVTLLIVAVRTQKPQEYVDIQKAFGQAVAEDQPWETKVSIFGALWSAVSSGAADRKALWKSDHIRKILLETANSEEETSDVLAIVMGAMWAFTGDDDLDRERVWAEEGSRTAIVAGLKAEQRVDVRVPALNAVANLAMSEKLRVQLWTEAEGELAKTLLAGAAGDQPADIRETCLRALAELSWAEKNRKPMSWAGPLGTCLGPLGAHTLLYDAFEDWSIDRKVRLRYKYAHARLALVAPETLAIALVRARVASFLLPALGEEDIIEYVDPGTVAKCEGARVRQRIPDDLRVGKIIDVEHGVLDVTVRWENTLFRKLLPGELSYLEEDKPGDPAEAPDPEELLNIRVRHVHGRVGTIVKAQQRRDRAVKAEVRWDLQVFTAFQLGPSGELDFVRTPNLRLVSRSIKDCVLPPGPPPPEDEGVPEEEQEPPPPPPERILGRAEFEEFEDYVKYVAKLMKDNGGEANAIMQYYSDKPFCGVHTGMEGPIVRFDNMECFAVRWEGFEKKFVDMWRCQFLQTADQRWRWTEPVPEPDYDGGGGSSGPDWDQAASFEGAVLPSSHTFTLWTRIRTTKKGEIQQFVSWQAPLDSAIPRRSLDFRLRENGNLEYGEHTGQISSGWRAVAASPCLHLADGKWHSVAVVRYTKHYTKEGDSGNVSLFCDNKLVGQGVIQADIPPGLGVGARSGRALKGDWVFNGRVAPLRIYNQELSIGQVKAVDILTGVPRFLD